jgi:sugar phosphate isomerase/epimerase
MRRVGLEYLSVFGMHPVQYVELAAELGFDFASVNLAGAANAPDPCHRFALRQDAGLRHAVADASKRTGLSIELVEGLMITPESRAAALIRDLDAATELRATSVCITNLLRDFDQGCEEFRSAAELAAQRGLRVTTEVGVGLARTFAAAAAIVQRVDHPAFTLLIDTMHFFRRDGTLEALAALDPRHIGHIQLNDVPMPASLKNYLDEALFERRAPGDGDLPLASFLGLIAEQVAVGLEVPIRSVDGTAGLPQQLAEIRRKAQKLIAGIQIGRPAKQ